MLENREFHYQKHNTTRSGYTLARKQHTSTTKNTKLQGMAMPSLKHHEPPLPKHKTTMGIPIIFIQI